MLFVVKDTEVIFGTEKGERVHLGPGDTIELPESVGRKNPHLEPKGKLKEK